MKLQQRLFGFNFGLRVRKGGSRWMRFFLTDTNNKDWEAKAQVIIARFRADYAHFPNDPRFKELIDEFMQTSQLFRETWPLHDVQVVNDCHKRLYDNRIGEMEFQHVTLQPPTHPDLKIMIYTASMDTAARLRSLMNI
ncbi:hypothetical protein H1230_17395 [Paenibacillus sp. 19GGS1-52]|nr:hypothetical protein H1230_17395 [Paenibacillus sp. 19GGS1-52]